MKISLDTNVLVSGLLQSRGPSGAIVTDVASGAHRVCYDDRVLDEYERVLRRPKFSFDLDAVALIIDQIRADGIPVECERLPADLPDRDDEKFVEVAIAGKADFLITGNLRHYPADRRYGIRVVSPREFITRLGG